MNTVKWPLKGSWILEHWKLAFERELKVGFWKVSNCFHPGTPWSMWKHCFLEWPMPLFPKRLWWKICFLCFLCFLSDAVCLKIWCSVLLGRVLCVGRVGRVNLQFVLVDSMLIPFRHFSRWRIPVHQVGLQQMPPKLNKNRLFEHCVFELLDKPGKPVGVKYAWIR